MHTTCGCSRGAASEEVLASEAIREGENSINGGVPTPVPPLRHPQFNLEAQVTLPNTPLSSRVPFGLTVVWETLQTVLSRQPLVATLSPAVAAPLV